MCQLSYISPQHKTVHVHPLYSNLPNPVAVSRCGQLCPLGHLLKTRHFLFVVDWSSSLTFPDTDKLQVMCPYLEHATYVLCLSKLGRSIIVFYNTTWTVLREEVYCSIILGNCNYCSHILNYLTMVCCRLVGKLQTGKYSLKPATHVKTQVKAHQVQVRSWVISLWISSQFPSHHSSPITMIVGFVCF